MSKNGILLIIVMQFILFNIAAQESVKCDEKFTNEIISKSSHLKAGPGDYLVYHPTDIYHSNPWPNEQKNFIIDRYDDAGDINGDGIIDMYYTQLCADERTGEVYDKIHKTIIIFGGADLSVLSEQILYVEIIPLGDLNGDGYADAIGINENQSWQYYFGSGAGLVPNAIRYTTNLPTIVCTSFDIDDDGYGDYLTSSATGKFDIIFGNDLPENFVKISYSPDFCDVAYTEKYFRVEDLDGTGYKLINFYFEDNYERSLRIIEMDPADRTLSLSQTERATTRPESIDIVDVNGDRIKEIIYTTAANSFSTLMNHTYVFTKNSVNEEYADSVKMHETPIRYIGDINNDQKADFYFYDHTNAAARIALGKTSFIGNLNYDMYLNFNDSEDGDYTYVHSANPLGDISGDGMDDFCFSVDIPEYFGHRFFLGNSSSHTISDDLLYDKATYEEDKLFQTKNIGDINGDGNEDVAYIGRSFDFVKIYTNGTFNTPDFEIRPGGSEKTQLVECGDFNGDNYTDLAILMKDAETYSNTRIDFYYGSPSFDLTVDHTIYFTFDLSIDIISNDGFGVKYIGDINNDNIDDFLLYGDSKAFIFYGKAILTTVPEHTIIGTNHFGARTTAPGDMNGDGIDDFAMSGCRNEGVNVYFGKGSSASTDAYSTPDLFLSSDQVSQYYGLGMSLTGGDFNGDGYADIATMPYQFRETRGSGDGVEGLYIYYGGENMDTIPDKLLKIQAEAFEVDVVNYINQFVGELTCLPDMNGDDCNELFLAGWYVKSPDNSTSQSLLNGIALFGGAYLNTDSIPYIQFYSHLPNFGAYNAYFFTDAHSAIGDFDRDGKREMLITVDNSNFLGGSVYKYSVDPLNHTPNHTPTNITLTNLSIDEDLSVGAVVGTLSSTDSDISDTHTYSLVVGDGDTDNSSFTISSDTLKSAVVFDYETKSSYSIRIQTDDGNGGTFSKSFVITVNEFSLPEGWTVNPSEYAYDGEVTAEIFIDDDTTGAGILAAFVDGVCRGVMSEPQRGPTNKLIYIMRVYSNQASGENIEFKFLANSEDGIMDINEKIPFNSDMTIGSAIAPFEMNAYTYLDYSKSMTSGWNWFSVYLENDSMALDQILTTLNPQAGDYIKDRKGTGNSATFYDQSGFKGWFGTLSELDPKETYKIKLNNSGEMTYQGSPFDFANEVIPVNAGWNWIGYPLSTGMLVSDYLNSLIKVENDYIKDQLVSSTYYSGYGWYGQLENMQPGNGYVLKVTNSGSISGADFTNLKSINPMVSKYLILPKSEYFLKVQDFEFSGSSMIKVMVDSQNIGSEENVLYAFNQDDVCVGIINGLYYPMTDEYLYNLMMYSNAEKGDEIHFKFFENQENKWYTFEEKIQFEEDMIVADAYHPFVLDHAIDKESDKMENLNLKVYPNPFTNSFRYSFSLTENSEVRISLVNALGGFVDVLKDDSFNEGKYNFNYINTSLFPGVYYLRIELDGKISVIPIVKQ